MREHGDSNTHHPMVAAAAAFSAFPVLAGAAVIIWTLDGALIGGALGTICNLS